MDETRDRDKDVQLLSKVTANHMFLGQFEPFRATLRSLRARNLDLARMILQTVVSRGGRLSQTEMIAWSHSCPNPNVLTFMCALELIEFAEPTVNLWSFDGEMLRLRSEFLLYVDMVRNRVLEREGFESEEVLRVLERIEELGLSRLRPDLIDLDDGFEGRGFVGLNEEELMKLSDVILVNSDVFEILCVNIEEQLRGCAQKKELGSWAIALPKVVRHRDVEEEEERVLRLVKRLVQQAHLDAIKRCLEDGDVDSAASRVRFLNLNCEIEEAEYRFVLQDLLKRLLSGNHDYGETSVAVRNKVLSLYAEALSSRCTRLVQLLQLIQDDILSKKIEDYNARDSDQTPFPLRCLQKFIARLGPETISNHGPLSLKMATDICMRDLYHYARVRGLHVMEVVVDTALCLVQKEQIEEACQVLRLFPKLQPLVSALGWDLLSGKTKLRKKLMQSLWTSKSRAVRLEESSPYKDKSDEMSCIEHLCDTLCYKLDIASFIACVNAGRSWSIKSSILLSGKALEDTQLDPFVENFALERLSIQSPLRVIFDLVPNIKFQDAVELLSMQPITSTSAAWKRMQDIELMHIRYGLESSFLALGAMEKSTSGGKIDQQMALSYLKGLKNHLDAVTDIPRKIYMVNMIISLLHMDNLHLDFASYDVMRSSLESFNIHEPGPADSITREEGNEMVVAFTGQILDILRRQLPLLTADLDDSLDGHTYTGSKQALEWRLMKVKHFLEDWEWRLSILQRLLPLSERQWKWKEALTVLRAAPSKLLNLCMQRAKYDIGEEAISRFSLPPEDKATLELTEWVDEAFSKASVEEVVSRAADGSSVPELDFLSLRAQLGSLPAILLCVDVAATCSKLPDLSIKLLNQAQIMLSEIYPGAVPKAGPTYWDQVCEMTIISVVKRVLRRLCELLEQKSKKLAYMLADFGSLCVKNLHDSTSGTNLLVEAYQDKPPALQSFFSGEMILSLSKDFHGQGNRDRALVMLHQMVEDAHKVKQQFLSGKLHNLARAIADEEAERDRVGVEGSQSDVKGLPGLEKNVLLGLGLRASKKSVVTPEPGENDVNFARYDIKDSERRLYGPFGPKIPTFLSQFILHIAAIGDIVDGTDTTHNFNYFSLIYEWPKDLLIRLVFERGSTDAAAKVAEIMNLDFVHEVISACVPPVYPPRSGHGWACIPVIPSLPKGDNGSKVQSPSFREAKPKFYTPSSVIPGVPLYQLKLDVVKHLVNLSPVRATLACVFGSSMLYLASDPAISSSLNDGLLTTPDLDRVFYEFSLDQSDRFPTLNRWIQMQTNLHRVSEFAVRTDVKDDPELKTCVKRYRENDSDSESESDAVSGSNIPLELPEVKGKGNADSDAWHNAPKVETSKREDTVFLSFDWENEGPYEKAVERLIYDGKLQDALALSDRFLRKGASDRLLEMLVINDEETFLEQPQGSSGLRIWSNSWQYCLRMKDKQIASSLALRYLHTWELEHALDVLAMCSCHLADDDPLKIEVVQRRQDLHRCKHILSADERYSSWQEVEADCKEDPEGLALRLAEKGAVSAALEVAESAGLSIDLRRELQGRQLVKLLNADPVNGGGPAEASRFLSSLRDSNDALPVAISAMQLLPSLRSKQLLVHFFLKRRDGNLSEIEVSRLNSWALGLRVLASLPLPWQQRCSSLHEHPQLILEVLLMSKQIHSASLIIKEFPSLRDNGMILAYAAKAIAVNMTAPPRDSRISVIGPRPKPRMKPSTPTRSSLTSSLSHLQKEARRAFSWTPRNTGDKGAPKDSQRKRKSSGLTQSEKVALEAMTGIQEDRVSVFTSERQERHPSASIAAEWMLTGDPAKDEVVRSSHRYESSPDITLFKALLSLCSDESVSGKGALELCMNQMKTVASSQQLPEDASMETIGRVYHATETFVQGLLFAKQQLRKFSGASDLSSNSEKGRDVDETSSDAGSSSMGSQSTDELSEAISQVDLWLGRAELLQSLLGSGISASLDDVADKESSERLRDRLIQEERYSMAVYTSKKCKIDVFPVWNSWGHALLRMEHYAQARVKFKQALQLHKGDSNPVILEIINTIEGGPPVDVASVRSMYEHLAKSAPAVLDDPLSADSYLNVLYMPSTFPRSERSRRSQEAMKDNSTRGSDVDDGPRSNLDNTRYLECVNYLQEYARQNLLDFMFRHGRFKEACFLFFPPNSIPNQPQPSSLGVVASNSSPQRPDPLATDYGTIDDLCDLCVGYGALPVLEEVISSRIETEHDDSVIQHTTAAVARICLYCETHKNFNYLYKFQVIKKDYVAAGLCCIQLFMNSTSLEDAAVKHLEHAKMHFDEALSARYKVSESTKLVTKGIRGKTASEKLTEEGLVKFSARIAIQIDVVRSFNDTDGPQWKHSLFGNPNDPETFRRRCEIAETLAEKNFDLTFQIVYEFNLPAVDIYAGVAASLAERKRGGQLTEFFRNIKGTIDDDDWDQVLGAAINVYANKHKERPDRLIDMLTSSHRKVLACVVCGRLKSAFQIASRSGSVADVQYVAHQALHANALPVLDMCKQWLAQYM